MKTRIIPLLLVAAAIACGLGALSDGLVADIVVELQTRSLRERVNQDLMRGMSPSGEAYFDGRAAGFAAVAAQDIRRPHTAEFLQGVGEAFVQSAELLSRAERTGTIDPTLP